MRRMLTVDGWVAIEEGSGNGVDAASANGQTMANVSFIVGEYTMVPRDGFPNDCTFVFEVRVFKKISLHCPTDAYISSLQLRRNSRRPCSHNIGQQSPSGWFHGQYETFTPQGDMTGNRSEV